MIINVRGADWFYTDSGEGDPVLFLHGGLDTVANYSRLLAELASDFQVIAVDRRGHGRSEDTDMPFDYALMADEVHEFAMKLGLRLFHILGYSDGANIGFHLAADHPEAVKSLVAVSGNYKGLSGMSQKWLDMLPELSVEFSRERMPKVVEQYTMLNPHPDLAAFMEKTKAIWTLETVISREKLGRITTKTLLVSGDRDIVLPEQAVEMHGIIPDSSLMILPDTGHFIFQDSAYRPPAASAVPVLKNFLGKNSVPA